MWSDEPFFAHVCPLFAPICAQAIWELGEASGEPQLRAMPSTNSSAGRHRLPSVRVSARVTLRVVDGDARFVDSATNLREPSVRRHRPSAGSFHVALLGHHRREDHPPALCECCPNSGRRHPRRRLVVVVDDDDRANEGDLIVPAQTATPQQIAFMVRHTTGTLCVPMTAERAELLRCGRGACASCDGRAACWPIWAASTSNGFCRPSTALNGVQRTPSDPSRQWLTAVGAGRRRLGELCSGAKINATPLGAWVKARSARQPAIFSGSSRLLLFGGGVSMERAVDSAVGHDPQDCDEDERSGGEPEVRASSHRSKTRP